MRVVVEVKNGSEAGRKFVVRSGQVVQIGRGRQADLAFPADSFMSSMHCLLHCGVKTVTICDHGSTNGIRVNGNKTRTIALKSGDEIMAGQTNFVVWLQHDSKTPEFDTSALTGRSLLSALRGEFQPLYAILDAARDIKILQLLRQAGPEHQSLYEGAQAEDLAEVAPYLVRLPRDSPLLKTWESEGRTNSWGVFLTCDLPLVELRKHLRRFLTVKLPGGETALFRFYDPRVLRLFLPTTEKEEAVDFFGPVKSFLVEDQEPLDLLRFCLERDGVTSATLTLAPSVGAPS